MTKRTEIILLGSLLCILLICALVTCTDSGLSRAEAAVSSYNEQVAIYNDAAIAFNTSIQPIIDANNALDEVIASSQVLLDAGDIPFDPQTKTTLEDAVLTATQAKVSVPTEGRVAMQQQTNLRILLILHSLRPRPFVLLKFHPL